MNPAQFEKIVKYWHEKLQSAQIYNLHYLDLYDNLKQIDDKSFLFLDPPYELTKGQYQVKKFNHAEFVEFLGALNDANIPFMCCMDENTNLIPARIARKIEISKQNSSLSRLKGKTTYIQESIFVNY